jgi:hypothetical protein
MRGICCHVEKTRQTNLVSAPARPLTPKRKSRGRPVMIGATVFAIGILAGTRSTAGLFQLRVIARKDEAFAKTGPTFSRQHGNWDFRGP